MIACYTPFSNWIACKAKEARLPFIYPTPALLENFTEWIAFNSTGHISFGVSVKEKTVLKFVIWLF